MLRVLIVDDEHLARQAMRRPGSNAVISRLQEKIAQLLHEMFVVLAILGFALVLVVGYGAPVGRGLDLRGSAATLASGLRLARSEAILNNRAVVFDLDLAGHRFRPGSGAVTGCATSACNPCSVTG